MSKMADLLTLVLEIFSFTCLVIVSVSLLRLYNREKALPPLLMGLAYVNTSIVVLIIFIRDFLNLPYEFLFMENFFDTFPLMLVPLSPAFMWLFKLEVFDGGLRANRNKIIGYGLGLGLFTFLMMLEILIIDFTTELVIFAVVLVLILVVYALGTYFYSLISILPKYEDRIYRVKTQLLLLSLLMFIFCITSLIISVIVLNVFNGDPLMYETIAWIGCTISSFLALFSFSIPKVIQAKLGLA
ncbi:MAG: hypothetical protein ACFFBD_06615 [Candidatus Hodarchaeota archaeon]